MYILNEPRSGIESVLVFCDDVLKRGRIEDIEKLRLMNDTMRTLGQTDSVCVDVTMFTPKSPSTLATPL